MAVAPDQASAFVDAVDEAIAAEPSIGKPQLNERLATTLGMPKVRAAARLNLVMEVFAIELGSDSYLVFRRWLGGVGPTPPAEGSPEATARDLDAVWRRIERWIRDRTSDGEWLHPAATGALQQVMETYQEHVPLQWLGSLACHDGDLPGIFGEVTLYTLDQAEDALAEDEAHGDIGWPIGQTRRGTVYIDPLGQVVEIVEAHGKPRVLAVSFVAWLQSRADALEAGRVLWHPLFDEPVVADQFPDLNALTTAVGDLPSITEAVFVALLAGSEVPLPGLGALALQLRPAHRVHDPRTRGPVTVPARRRVVFTADEALKDLLNGGPTPAPIVALPAWAKESLSPDALLTLVGALRDALMGGRVGSWPGLGEFSVMRSEPVAFTNPINGTPVNIPGRTTAHFRQYPAVRARLNP